MSRDHGVVGADRNTKRQTLFSDFIVEASRLHGDALSHEKDDVNDLAQFYALVAQIRTWAKQGHTSFLLERLGLHRTGGERHNLDLVRAGQP